MREYPLDARLSGVAALVPAGAKILDVGTDHAYLPIALCKAGQVRAAVASDLNRGPLETAQKNIAAAGLSGKIETRLCDGLQGLEDTDPDAILICGMGGELIASILGAAPWIKRKGIVLVLQPMTHAQDLREWLAGNGFCIMNETLSLTDRIYQTFSAVYDGQIRTQTLPELWFGAGAERQGDELFARWMREQKSALERIRDAKRGAGQDTATEDTLLAYIEEVLSE